MLPRILRLPTIKTTLKGVKRSHIGVILLSVLMIYALKSIFGMYVDCLEAECSIDYLPANLMKPFYKLRCPVVNIDISSCSSLPKIIVMNARPLEIRLNAFNSWSRLNLTVINTKALEEKTSSSSLPLLNSECAQATWSNHLFSIYIKVFEHVLATYSAEKDFIFIEDDAFLLDSNKLMVETCMVQKYKYSFYSFFRTGDQQNTCIFHHGTVAFYASRRFIERFIKLDLRTICRLSIDIYIATIGPWYATTSYIVKHNSSRYRL